MDRFKHRNDLTKNLKTYGILLFAFLTTSLCSQSANVLEGCAPLEVEFSAPFLAGYYWEFKDGSSSVLSNPTHIFTSPGNYNVELRLEAGGALIGSINIKVFDDPQIQIASNIVQGCSPLTVNFTSDILVDSEIQIDSINWSFGDGKTSSESNPIHVFNSPGIYDVSLKVVTDIDACTKTIIVNDMIEVFGPQAEFVSDKLWICETPASFNFMNLTEVAAGNSYEWDFGNGQNSTDYNPPTIVYNTEGTYTISLKVVDAEGCFSIKNRDVVVGKPDFEIIAPDTVCLNQASVFQANIVSPFYEWTFEGGELLIDNNQNHMWVSYDSLGIYTANLTLSTGGNCISDTTFQIVVDNPSAEFTIDPEYSCFDEASVVYTAEQAGLTYTWSFDDSLNVQSVEREYICPPRDSHFVNYEILFVTTLIVETDQGCKNDSRDTFRFLKPEAYFIPDVTRGCAPLTVTFSNVSRGGMGVVSDLWDYGDGTTAENTGFTHEHVYEEPGEYYVKMIVETIEGCIDTSAGVWIFVGESILPEYTIDQTEICLGDSISVDITNDDDRIDAWHFYSDDGRFNHCWDQPSATHQFITEPGVFDATISVDYNGCITEIVEPGLITVNGAKALVDYTIECDRPNEVQFESSSISADFLNWDLDNGSSNETSFVHQYPSTGDYTVILEATDLASGCPSTFDTVDIFIRNIEAIFAAPDTTCGDSLYQIIATASIDVDPDCSQGYIYEAPGLPRPIKTHCDTMFIENPMGGDYLASLIVQDVNGCKDTAYQEISVYGIYPEIEFDERACYYQGIEFNNLSLSDTTIAIYDWSFGSNESDPVLVYDSLPDPTELIFTLEMEDIFGCQASILDTIEFYDINSNFIFAPGPLICPGTEVFFFASQFTGEGSFLEYQWDFGNGQTSIDSFTSTVFLETGVYDGSMTYTEAESGCSKTVSFQLEAAGPEALFSSDFDDVPVICYPKQIQFYNESIVPPPDHVRYTWTSPGSADSGEENPTFSFDKGTHDISLIVEDTIRNCLDTLTKTYTLVGPEGGLALDKTKICLGDSITFSLVDTADVNTFIWDFGDGIVAENQSPVTHVFDQYPTDGMVQINLILKAVEDECEFTDTITIEVVDLIPAFEILDVNECLASIDLIGLNGESLVYEWEFGDGNIAEGNAVQHEYTAPGMYEITYSVSDPEVGCRMSITEAVAFEDLTLEYFIPNVFSPNGDERNDFFNILIDENLQDDVEILAFKIFNRWGEMVYNNLSPQEGWDGRFEAELAPAEVYAYYIEASVQGCEPVVIKGNITLLR